MTLAFEFMFVALRSLMFWGVGKKKFDVSRGTNLNLVMCITAKHFIGLLVQTSKCTFFLKRRKM